MARSQIKVASENFPPAEETLDFDDDNLKGEEKLFINQNLPLSMNLVLINVFSLCESFTWNDLLISTMSQIYFSHSGADHKIFSYFNSFGAKVDFCRHLEVQSLYHL